MKIRKQPGRRFGPEPTHKASQQAPQPQPHAMRLYAYHQQTGRRVSTAAARTPLVRTPLWTVGLSPRRRARELGLTDRQRRRYEKKLRREG